VRFKISDASGSAGLSGPARGRRRSPERLRYR